MTTFTKLDHGQPPSLSVYPEHRLSKINPNIYGGFTEQVHTQHADARHMGRCIYGGLYDPSNKNADLIDSHGFRKDVMAALRELDIPVVRYPGGNFCATYHWLDGVGPKDKRPRRPELAWLGVESNEFGTDEFMRWCAELGTEPYLCLNMGTGTLDEALAWLEYCNSSQDTYYANLRRKNGRDKPYGVKYWALGNECWGAWQVEQSTKEDYAKKAYQWAKALKLLDPSIQLILCGETGHSTWDQYVLKQCVKPDGHALGGNAEKSLIDMHSIHIYTTSNDPIKNAFAPRSAERAIEVCASLIDLARLENGVPPKAPRQTICFDEWNVWDPSRAIGSEGAEEKYTMSDALAVAVWLNVFIRQSKHLGMANLAQSVNVISPLMTTKDGIVKQTTWWPLLLFSKYMRGHTLATHVSCAAYEGETAPAWLQGAMDTPWLDVSATMHEGMVSMAVVNLSMDESHEIEVDGLSVESGNVKVYSVAAEKWDATNTADNEAVKVREFDWDGKGKFSFPKFSITMLRWQV